MEIISILVAFGAGIFGAAIGALPAFIFVGFLILTGVAIQAGGGSTAFLDFVPLGPAFGPHVAGFASGVAAAGYAAKKGKMPTGRDIALPIMGLDAPVALLIGGLFGVLGYLLNWVFGLVGFAWTDTIALTVTVSAIIVRILWGNGVFGKVAAGESRFSPTDATKWIAYQNSLAQRIVIGLGAGLMASFFALQLGAENGGVLLGFAISAASLVFLQVGAKVPVTHHITLVAAVAAAASGSYIWGALFGVGAAIVGEYMACLFLVHGDTHIDPPAATIAALTSLSLLLAALGVYNIPLP